MLFCRLTKNSYGAISGGRAYLNSRSTVLTGNRPPSKRAVPARPANLITSLECVSARGAISLLPPLTVERGFFFPAEYLLRRRRVQSLLDRRPGGSRLRIPLGGRWGCA